MEYHLATTSKNVKNIMLREVRQIKEYMVYASINKVVELIPGQTPESGCFRVGRRQ